MISIFMIGFFNFFGRKNFFCQRKNENRESKRTTEPIFFYEDVKMSFKIDTLDFLKITLPEGEIFGKLRRLPKTGTIKRVFHRECNNE